MFVRGSKALLLAAVDVQNLAHHCKELDPWAANSIAYKWVACTLYNTIWKYIHILPSAAIEEVVEELYKQSKCQFVQGIVLNQYVIQTHICN